MNFHRGAEISSDSASGGPHSSPTHSVPKLRRKLYSVSRTNNKSLPNLIPTTPTSRTDSPYRYRFGPFDLRSELPIPELAASTGPGTLPVSITLGDTPRSLPGAPTYGELCQVAPAEYLLNIPGVARFHVRDGSEVRVTLHPGAPAADVSAYLLGSVFGALCHQNALLPLHASAVQTHGRITAFLGESGAGKSTLAACLARRGHAILSDDICLLQPDPASNTMNVIPVASWLKLWRQSLDHLGQTPDERHRVYQADDKFRLYLPPGITSTATEPTSRTLAHLVFLSRAASPDTPPRLEPLPTIATIAEMMRLTYLGYITELTSSHARVFAQCARVLNTAKGYRLTVPWNLLKIDSTLDLLDRTLFVP